MAAAESLIPRADAAIRQMTFHAPNSSNLPTRVMLTRRLSSALDFLLGKNRGNAIKVLIMSSSENANKTLLPAKLRIDRPFFTQLLFTLAESQLWTIQLKPMNKVNFKNIPFQPCSKASTIAF